MIDKKSALKIARDECVRRGWLWNEKSIVKWGLFSYTVWGGGRKGGNLCIKIRKRDGKVLIASISTK
jgi:hypothetical protein